MNMLTQPAVTMSSREIAELTGKEHKNVKRDIEKTLNELGEDTLKFERIYRDSMNREQTEYVLDRDHTETVLLSYSAELRLRVVRRLRELEAGASRPLTTTETLIQMLTLQADVERRQILQQQALDAMDARVARVEDTASLTSKPQNTETLSDVRVRIKRKYGLPPRIVDFVLMKITYHIRPFGMVKNSHENAQGSSFAVYHSIDVTKLFKRFVAECEQVTATMATHAEIEGRFKLVKG
jgi:phage regulator Rha-like protein